MDMQSHRSFPRMTAFSVVLLFGLAFLHGCSSVPYLSSEDSSQDSQPTESDPVAVPPAENLSDKSERASSEIKAEHKPIPFEQILKEEKQKKNQPVVKKKVSKPAPKLTQTAQDAPKPVTPKTKVAVKKQPEKNAAPELKTPEPLEVEAKQAVSEISTKPNEIQFNLEQLPLTIANNWTLKTDLSSCSLHSKTLSLDDGAGKTPVSLVLNDSSWVLLTKSDIDTSYTDTGIDLDSGEHFDLEDVSKETNVEFTEQRQALIEALPNATSATISLGFWPTWPVSQAKTLEIPVSNFASAFQAWQSCNQMLSAR